jgi:hypothetical protein
MNYYSYLRGLLKSCRNMTIVPLERSDLYVTIEKNLSIAHEIITIQI